MGPQAPQAPSLLFALWDHLLLQGPGHLPKTFPGLPLFSTFQFPPPWETPGSLSPFKALPPFSAPSSLQAEPQPYRTPPPPSRVLLCSPCSFLPPGFLSFVSLFTPSRALTETGSPPSGTPLNPLVPSSFWGHSLHPSRGPSPSDRPSASRLSSLPSGDPSPLSEAPSVLQGHYHGHTLPT